MARGGGRMGITELLVAAFPALAFEIVRFAVPGRYLPEFTYGGATYDVDASLARGWVDELVDANALMERARSAAQEMARLSPKAFTQTKKQLRQETFERVERGGAMTDQTVADIWTEAWLYRDYVARTLNKS